MGDREGHETERLGREREKERERERTQTHIHTHIHTHTQVQTFFIQYLDPGWFIQ
jgi:hypothetical protein